MIFLCEIPKSPWKKTGDFWDTFCTPGQMENCEHLAVSLLVVQPAVNSEYFYGIDDHSES